MRSCLNSAGPREMSLMPTAISAIKGARTGKAAQMHNRSSNRFQSGIPTAWRNGAGMLKAPSFTVDGCCLLTYTPSADTYSDGRRRPEYGALTFVNSDRSDEIVQNFVQKLLDFSVWRKGNVNDIPSLQRHVQRATLDYFCIVNGCNHWMGEGAADNCHMRWIR